MESSNSKIIKLLVQLFKWSYYINCIHRRRFKI